MEKIQTIRVKDEFILKSKTAKFCVETEELYEPFESVFLPEVDRPQYYHEDAAPLVCTNKRDHYKEEEALYVSNNLALVCTDKRDDYEEEALPMFNNQSAPLVCTNKTDEFEEEVLPVSNNQKDVYFSVAGPAQNVVRIMFHSKKQGDNSQLKPTKSALHKEKKKDVPKYTCPYCTDSYLKMTRTVFFDTPEALNNHMKFAHLTLLSG